MLLVQQWDLVAVDELGAAVDAELAERHELRVDFIL